MNKLWHFQPREHNSVIKSNKVRITQNVDGFQVYYPE